MAKNRRVPSGKHKKGTSPLENQIRKIFRHCKGGSFRTRAGYEAKSLQFARFIHQKFRLQNVKNMSDKHVVAYIQYRQEQGLAAKTVKDDLSAIRFMHNHISQARHELSENKGLKENYGLELEKTYSKNGDRAWTEQEYQGMLKVTEGLGRQDMKDAIVLCRNMGFRISEVMCMRREQAQKALQTGVYQVMGEAKNGRWRQVPVRNHEVREILTRRLAETTSNARIFVPEEVKADVVINRAENFIKCHRDKVRTAEGIQQRTLERMDQHGNIIEIRQNEINWHGLRYMYVQERVDEVMNERDYTLEEASQVVTEEVGHSRTEIIEIYLAK